MAEHDTGTRQYEVVLTPLTAEKGSKVMKVERLTSQQIQKANVQHVAGGPYEGIIVSRATNERPSDFAADTQRVLLAQVANHHVANPEVPVQEKRELRFWFKPSKKPKPKSREKKTNEFMQDLLKTMPRGYIGFIKRTLELMKEYPTINKVELDFRPATRHDLAHHNQDIHVTKVTNVTRTKVTKKTSHSDQERVDGTDQGRLRQNGSPGQLESHVEVTEASQLGSSYHNNAETEMIAQKTMASSPGDTKKGKSPKTKKRSTVNKNKDIATATTTTTHTDTFLNNNKEAAVVVPVAAVSPADKKGKLPKTKKKPIINQNREITTTTTTHTDNFINNNTDSTRKDQNTEIYPVDNSKEKSYKTRNQQAVNENREITTAVTTTTHTDNLTNNNKEAIVASQAVSSIHRKKDKSSRTKKRSVDKDGVVHEQLVAVSGPLTGGNGNPYYTAELQQSEETKSSNTTGDAYEEEVVAVNSSVTGGGGNPYYSSMLEQTENTSYHSTYQRTKATVVEEEVVAVNSVGTGGGGNPHYMSRFENEARDSSDDVEEDEVVAISSAPTGGKGNPYYAKELKKEDSETKKNTKFTDRTEEEVVTMRTTVGRAPRTRGALSAQTDSTGSVPEDIGDTLSVIAKSPNKSIIGDSTAVTTYKVTILTILEDAYPNIIGVDEIVRVTRLRVGDVEYIMQELSTEGKVQEIQRGYWIRVQTIVKRTTTTTSSTSRDSHLKKEDETARKHDFQVVTVVPRLPVAEQPTVAIVTVLYCEKLAVDAMMNPKTTYIRYKAEGEGSVYTVGMIGKHRVVCTKLARVGERRGDKTSAGNTVTRLLGIFGRIEHVMMVGVAGGVANYQDDLRHVRLGDVVVSKSEFKGAPLYIECTGMDGQNSFIVQDWKAADDQLVTMADKLHDIYERESSVRRPSWHKFMLEALDELPAEPSFERPSDASDRLYKIVKGQPVYVEHPDVREGSQRYRYPDVPVVHRGVVGCGKHLIRDEQTREEFALFNGVLCVDSGVQAAMESVDGNRKESFALIRGIADYEDGVQRKEWQAYAALSAAAYMKAILLELPSSVDDDDD